jgi:NADH:ubiquinone oxidoreductase subunit 3 (subunit A)
MGASSMIVLILAALAFSGIAILIAKIVTKSTTNPQKQEPYECGIPTGKNLDPAQCGILSFCTDLPDF